MIIKESRVLVVFIIFFIGFTAILISLFFLSSNLEYASMAQKQAEAVIELSEGRGNIYDCNFMPLTSVTQDSYALAVQGDEAYAEYFRRLDDEEIAMAYELYDSKTPYLVQVTEANEDNPFEFSTSSRYVNNQIASNLIGFLDNSGDGAQGIEKAFNDLLSGGGVAYDITYNKGALGEIMYNTEPNVIRENGTGQGVLLTIDSTIQRICEGIAADSLHMGSIIVMETETGRIKAAVSYPQLFPNNILQNIEDDNTAFIDRTGTAFSVGSVIKPAIAAALLESGFDEDLTYVCDGSIEVSDMQYACYNHIAHGEVDLQDALAVSCNGYFVNYGLTLEPELLHDFTRELGFGVEVTEDSYTVSDSGYLPSSDELVNLGERASFSFGQGLVTATPIQITAMMNAIANDGVYVTPTIVEGIYNEFTHFVDVSLYRPVVKTVFSKSTAEIITEALALSITEGISKTAQPLFGYAAGKSGTAQTGRVLTDVLNDDGEPVDETVGWFSGFYPSDDPKYTITIMQDGTNTQSSEMAALFARVCNTMRYYDTELPQSDFPY